MYPNQRPKKKSNELVNEFIPYRFKNIRVVFPDGRSQVLSRDEGLRQAEALGLDLYCISPNGNPPVCKILNYSKYLFEKKKKEKEMKKNQEEIEVKEVRFTPLTDLHDLETKANQAIKFLEKGNRVKVSLFVKGRMISKMDAADNKINTFLDLVKEYGTCENKPTLEGKYYFCYVNPISKK